MKYGAKLARQNEEGAAGICRHRPSARSISDMAGRPSSVFQTIKRKSWSPVLFFKNYGSGVRSGEKCRARRKACWRRPPQAARRGEAVSSAPAISSVAWRPSMRRQAGRHRRAPAASKIMRACRRARPAALQICKLAAAPAARPSAKWPSCHRPKASAPQRQQARGRRIDKLLEELCMPWPSRRASAPKASSCGDRSAPPAGCRQHHPALARGKAMKRRPRRPKKWREAGEIKAISRPINESVS